MAQPTMADDHTAAEALRRKMEYGVDVSQPSTKAAHCRSPSGLEDKFKTNIYVHLKAKEPDQIEKTLHKVKPHFGKVAHHRHLKANQLFFALPWLTGGGCAVLVKKVDAIGRCEAEPFCLHGHTQQPTALDLSILDPHNITTGSDKAVMTWRIPEGGLTDQMNDPVSTFDIPGKPTVLVWSPRVQGLLAVAESSVDNGHNLRFIMTEANGDTSEGREVICISGVHNDNIMDVSFCPNSQFAATVCKDGFLRIFNIKEKALIREVEAKECNRDASVRWVSSSHVLVIGTGNGSARSVSLWDIEEGTQLSSKALGSTSDTLVPSYDADASILYLPSTGGRAISLFYISTRAPYFSALDEYKSAYIMRGHVALPKLCADVKEVELLKSFILTDNQVVPLSWCVLRKRTDYFQDDLIPPVWNGQPVCTVLEWIQTDGQKKFEESKMNICPEGMVPLSEAPKEEMTDRQKKYVNRKSKEEVPKPKSVLGYDNSDQVQKHFQNIAANKSSRNRWDAAPVDGDEPEVDDDEWEDSD